MRTALTTFMCLMAPVVGQAISFDSPNVCSVVNTPYFDETLEPRFFTALHQVGVTFDKNFFSGRRAAEL